MAKKIHARYVCQECGHSSPRWIGKCPACSAWNSFVEEIAPPASRRPRAEVPAGRSLPVSIADVEAIPDPRLPSGIAEFDRVLGGGIVPGSVTLVGGDPGIGKSTLMMQVAAAARDRVILYVTGEESVSQVKLRSGRLERPPGEKLLVLAETNLDVIGALVDRAPPDLMIVDSIQTMERPDLESAPGTVAQVRETTALFLRIAKERNIPVFLVGHVTKEGSIAGPKVIEHMVDTVVQFEGDRHYAYRILRTLKNRFGSTNEIGVFEMRDTGLAEVVNPSQAFLAERRAGTSGSAVVAGMEGTRPLLLEVQALVAPASYGVPQRSATGFDARRLQMLLAVLEKRIGVHTGQVDVFVNVAGGVRIDEPAADMGMAAAVVSSLRDRAVPGDAVAIGEIGLGGEIRSVSRLEQRVAEAAKMGFTTVVLPAANARRLRPPDGLRLAGVESVEDALRVLAGETEP